MSHRSLLEFNHDICPADSDLTKLVTFARGLANYMRSGDKRELPAGVTFIHKRHHTEPSPLDAKVVKAAIEAPSSGRLKGRRDK
jgi:hypothetical protein